MTNLRKIAIEVVERYGFCTSVQHKEKGFMVEVGNRLADAVSAPGTAGRSSFACWWAMLNAEAEICQETIPDDTVILHFMGSGASHQVTAKDIREMLAE